MAGDGADDREPAGHGGRKAVFPVEHAEPTEEFCAASRRLKLSSMLKKPEPGVGRKPC